MTPFTFHIIVITFQSSDDYTKDSLNDTVIFEPMPVLILHQLFLNITLFQYILKHKGKFQSS